MSDPLIEDIEYTALLVDTYLQTRIFKRYIADEHPESDGNQEERFKFEANGKEDEQQPYQNHYKMLVGSIGKTGKRVEGLDILPKEGPKATHNGYSVLSLFDYHEVGTFEDRIALTYLDIDYRTILVAVDVVFHLHCFKYE